MIEAGGRMKFEVTAEDLVTFADHLIAKAQEVKALELEMCIRDSLHSVQRR